MKKINGNCKAVRCLTNGKYYASVKEAAEANGVSMPSMSYAIHKGTRCNGKEFGFEINMEKNIMKMASNLSEATISREEMAEFYAWKAEQDALRKANEAREKKIAYLTAKVEHQREMVTKANDRLASETNKLMVLERELEDLTGMEVV